MFKTRPCGCKGLRSCKLCEENYGAWKIQQDYNVANEYVNIFCYHCKLLWSGFDVNGDSHPSHQGRPTSFPGIAVYPNFLSESEEEDLVKKLDSLPWELSQSGRWKQNFGPKCNFKKRKVQIDNFNGFPMFTKFIQDRFKDVNLLANFQTVEQCSLDYKAERGSSIDPHIDDCWIWGERIPTVSLVSDSVLTLRKYRGSSSRYNLTERLEYPCVVKEESGEDNLTENLEYPCVVKEESDEDKDKNYFSSFRDFAKYPETVQIPMPRRSLLILYGNARYQYEHFILREDIAQRRVCITYRELAPSFMTGGLYEETGKQILGNSFKFWTNLEESS